MGYETKMLVVEKSKCNNQLQSICIIGELIINGARVLGCKDERITQKVYQCYKESNDSYIYFPDSNTKTTLPSGVLVKEGPWCNIIAMVELGKCGAGPGICKFEDSDGHYAYDPFDGNSIIGLDGYGDYRKFVPIQEIIDIFQHEIKEAKTKGEVPYRRHVIALSTLKSAKASFQTNEIHEIGCLFYAH